MMLQQQQPLELPFIILIDIVIYGVFFRTYYIADDGNQCNDLINLYFALILNLIFQLVIKLFALGRG